MAFWGAPRPNPNHAQDACRTALEYQRALARLRERWREQGKSQLRARIGLHTGAAIVGNIGSEERLNYTSIGDAVNLTSRPIGLASPKYSLAALRLRMATRVDIARSRSMNARPSISRMPKVAK